MTQTLSVPTKLTRQCPNPFEMSIGYSSYLRAEDDDSDVVTAFGGFVCLARYMYMRALSITVD